MTQFKDHFSIANSDYATFRPNYPLELATYLASCSQNHELALDCGCGTGQLSGLLSNVFDKVIATDASAQQIAHAKPYPNVQYKHALAEKSCLDDTNVDLVATAQAAHWFDLDAFYAEVRRILRPNGIVALISYGVIETDGQIGNLLSEFYFESLRPFWPEERSYVETGYRTLPFPFLEIDSPSLIMRAIWTLDQLLGYVHTWSAIRCAETKLGRMFFQTFRDRLRSEWGDPKFHREFRWPLSMRVGHL